MNLRTFLWIVAIETLLSLGVLVAVVVFIDPVASGMAGLGLFYASTFFFISGLFVWLLSWVRGRHTGAEELPERIGVSFRQGILLGILTVVMLILQGARVLVWWVALIVGIVFLFLEMMFLFKRR